AGTFPEIWNTSANFADVPSSSTANIFDIIPYNDRLYIFTDAGLFTLQTYGPQTNWNFTPEDMSIIVTQQYQVCSTLNNLIYFTDNNEIWAYNGKTKKSVAAPIQGVVASNLANNAYG